MVIITTALYVWQLTSGQRGQCIMPSQFMTYAVSVSTNSCGDLRGFVPDLFLIGMAARAPFALHFLACCSDQAGASCQVARSG